MPISPISKLAAVAVPGRVDDLCARKIVDWATVSSMPAELVCAVLQVAIVQRHPATGWSCIRIGTVSRLIELVMTN